MDGGEKVPNYVQNRVRLSGDQSRIDDLLRTVQNDEEGLGSIDFDKIIPMPKELEIECGSRSHTGFKAYSDFISIYVLGQPDGKVDVFAIPESSEKAFLRERKYIDEETFAHGKQAYQNKIRFGHPDWYSWRIANWNTKWNACGYESGLDYSSGNCLHFQTAWSPPVPIIEKLAEQFPGVEFVHSWANEDLGMSCGRRVYQNGKVVEEYYPTGEEARSFANSVWGYEDEREANDMKLEELT